MSLIYFDWLNNFIDWFFIDWLLEQSFCWSNWFIFIDWTIDCVCGDWLFDLMCSNISGNQFGLPGSSIVKMHAQFQ